MREAHEEGIGSKITYPSSSSSSSSSLSSTTGSSAGVAVGAGAGHRDESDVIYFMRSGWTQSPKHTKLFWQGDQMVSWDKYDGIKTVVVSALSGGLSGHSLIHSDIGKTISILISYTVLTVNLTRIHVYTCIYMYI